jgi:hypothetical protein
MQAFMGAVLIVVGDPLRELFADVGRFGVGSVRELLLQYRSLHTLHFAIQVWGAGGIGRNRMASTFPLDFEGMQTATPRLAMVTTP